MARPRRLSALSPVLGRGELKARRIRVNAVSPGPIDTPLHNNLGDSHPDTAKIAAAMAAHIPVGRIGRADEVAAAVTFLASDQASFITGIELNVDGGLTGSETSDSAAV